MMYKSIIIIVFLSFAAYVASLTCLKCSDPKSCLKPKIEKCSEDVKYCASLEFRKMIGKGCMDRENICQQKSSLGQGFDHCSICQTDNCNTHVFT
ncbi:hypothetical protein WA026_007851 [Henosepilachna vigintioctopunctata]|uniref:Uncharacterized protein n=1 Tax=Henosepilachna vigintioctopunctata TaxID=420089 RepID=A0AAW1TV66_9CUCU